MFIGKYLRKILQICIEWHTSPNSMEHVDFATLISFYELCQNFRNCVFSRRYPSENLQSWRSFDANINSFILISKVVLTLRQIRTAFQFNSNNYDVMKSFFLSERNYAIWITSLSRQLPKYKIGLILISINTVRTPAGSGLWQNVYKTKAPGWKRYKIITICTNWTRLLEEESSESFRHFATWDGGVFGYFG